MMRTWTADRPGSWRGVRVAVLMGIAGLTGLGAPVHAHADTPRASGERPSGFDLTARRALLDNASLYVDPHSSARRQVDAWRGSRPGEAALLDRELASQPTGIWFGDWNRSLRTDVDRVMSDAARQRALPVLVAYNIPMRDCGSHSAGGARNAGSYRSWIADFARGLNGRPAIVILEPDALASTECLTQAQRAERFSLLKHATEVLSAQNALVYIDAGHAQWLSATETAARLLQAGVESAAGFALNVSNFIGNQANIRYGDEVSRRAGGAHFVIDTSRNGAGATADLQWCNPSGRALGTRPTTRTAHDKLDALLWVKKPGESDGSCNGGPRAGQWWGDYALGLAQRSTPVMALADARR
jgi:endoglucanase